MVTKAMVTEAHAGTTARADAARRSDGPRTVRASRNALAAFQAVRKTTGALSMYVLKMVSG